MANQFVTPQNNGTVSTNPGLVAVQYQVNDTPASDVLEVKLWGRKTEFAPGSFDNSFTYSMLRDPSDSSKWNGSLSCQEAANYTLSVWVVRKIVDGPQTITVTAQNP